MPPVAIHKDLTAAQKDTIRRWIAEGAEYEGHWAYQPVRRPAVPAAAASGEQSDRLLRVVAAAGGRTRAVPRGGSPHADSPRVAGSDRPGARPRRKWTRSWPTDRRARTNGWWIGCWRRPASRRSRRSTGSTPSDTPTRPASTATIRIPPGPTATTCSRRFSANKPFDEFTREQLAGDLLPAPSVDQKIASAFNRLNRVSGEGGLQEKEYLAKYGADRVRNGQLGVDGHHRRLRRVPRPQVRSDSRPRTSTR